jgi:hypothetical protein
VAAKRNAVRYGRIAAALLACAAMGAVSSIAIAKSSGQAASAAYYYYCPGGSAGSNYGYCPPTTTTTTTTTTTSTTTTTTTPPPPVPGFMTGGGQLDPIGPCTKASFGGNASGQPGGDAKGHFNYVDHCTGVHVNGPVTAILVVNPVTRTMTFEVQDDADCTAIVTWRDGGEPGTNDTIQVTFIGTDCPPDPTTVAVRLDRGNIQWHSNVRSDAQASGAAAGVFTKGATFQRLALQSSTLGFGAVIGGDGSALGQFQLELTGTTPSGQVRSISLEGNVTRGTVGTKGSVKLYGTALLRVDSVPPATLPFNVTATATSLVLTIGGVELKRQSLKAGSIFVG